MSAFFVEALLAQLLKPTDLSDDLLKDGVDYGSLILLLQRSQVWVDMNPCSRSSHTVEFCGACRCANQDLYLVFTSWLFPGTTLPSVPLGNTYLAISTKARLRGVLHPTAQRETKDSLAPTFNRHRMSPASHSLASFLRRQYNSTR
jgi:hypothetical protein